MKIAVVPTGAKVTSNLTGLDECLFHTNHPHPSKFRRPGGNCLRIGTESDLQALKKYWLPSLCFGERNRGEA